jgi:hypothetical protein
VQGIEVESTGNNYQSSFNPWRLVDVVRSPTLTKLIGALTIEEYEDIACRHDDTGRPHIAEPWWHRFIAAKKNNPEYRSLETLDGCLMIVRCLRRKGKYEKPLRLQQYLHQKLLKIFKPDHYLALKSRGVLMNIVRMYGSRMEEETLGRQRLQICLSSYGFRHVKTLEALAAMGFCLDRGNRYTKSEILLSSTIQVSVAMMKDAGANRLSNTAPDFSHCINRQEKYRGDAVLEEIYSLFRPLLLTSHPVCYYFNYVKAHSLRFRGRLTS